MGIEELVQRAETSNSSTTCLQMNTVTVPLMGSYLAAWLRLASTLRTPPLDGFTTPQLDQNISELP